MKYLIKVHLDAEKAFNKAPNRINAKIYKFLSHLMDFGTKNSPYKIKTLQGNFKKIHYLEAKIDKDYRIIFRYESDTFFIRDAGTHNQLRTG